MPKRLSFDIDLHRPFKNYTVNICAQSRNDKITLFNICRKRRQSLLRFNTVHKRVRLFIKVDFYFFAIGNENSF